MTSVLSVYFWNSSFRSARILSSKRSLLLSLLWSFVLSSSSPVPPRTAHIVFKKFLGNATSMFRVIVLLQPCAALSSAKIRSVPPRTFWYISGTVCFALHTFCQVNDCLYFHCCGRLYFRRHLLCCHVQPTLSLRNSWVMQSNDDFEERLVFSIK